jgi:hypothetical protein
MDRKRLNASLTKLLSAHRLGRYQGMVIAVASESDFEHLRIQLEAICLDYDLWRCPGTDNALDIPCARREFVASVFSRRPRDLVIFKPSEWMIDWSDPDQATFWNALADAFGRHDIIALAIATPSLIKQLRISLIEYRLPELPVSIWLSRHQPIDHLKEFLQ